MTQDFKTGEGLACWKPCNFCKKGIPFEGVYYRCSVSTCRTKSMPLYFCTMICFDGHLGFARHRDAYCEEEKAPSKEAYLREIKSQK